MKKTILLVLGTAMLLLAGCDSGNKTAPSAKETPAASESSTGRFALQKMLPSSRLWAPDAQPIRLESSNIKDSAGRDGKAITFVAEWDTEAWAAIRKLTGEAIREERLPLYG